MDIVTTDKLTGKTHPLWLTQAVDDLVVKTRKKDIWEIVDFCLSIWKQKYPKEHKAYLKEMKEYKADRANKYSSTKNKTYREIIVLPREVNYLLDKLAADRIADYGPKKFWHNFARRYSALSPAEII